LELRNRRLGKKVECWDYLAEKKTDNIFSRLSTIPMCLTDRQTDRHRSTTSIALTHSVVR